MTYRDRIARAYSWRYHPTLWFLVGIASGIVIHLIISVLVEVV